MKTENWKLKNHISATGSVSWSRACRRGSIIWRALKRRSAGTVVAQKTGAFHFWFSIFQFSVFRFQFSDFSFQFSVFGENWKMVRLRAQIPPQRRGLSENLQRYVWGHAHDGTDRVVGFPRIRSPPTRIFKFVATRKLKTENWKLKSENWKLKTENFRNLRSGSRRYDVGATCSLVTSGPGSRSPLKNISEIGFISEPENLDPRESGQLCLLHL